MARRRVELRKDEILAATVTQIELLGLTATRVQDVARSLGVSTALVFYHFATKDALLAAAFEHAVERDLARVEQAVRRGADPVDRLRRLLANYGPTGTAAGWTIWIDAWSAALREPTIKDSLRRLDRRWRQALERAVADGVTSGDFVCADPAATISRITGLIDGLTVACLVQRSVSRAKLRRWVIEAAAAEIGVEPSTLS